MKTRSLKFVLGGILILSMILLSGCTANLVTDIKSDGSGMWMMEYIMTLDELESYEYTLTDSFCAEDLELNMSDMPPGTTMRQEERGEEVACIFETPFTSLEELRSIYVGMDSTVNALEFRDNKFYYDIDIDMGSTDTMGFLIYWIVKMPGAVTETNATTQEGSTLTWEAPVEGTFNAYAVSSTGGLSGISSTWWWVIGISSLCCCFLVIVAIVVLVIVLNKKKKNKAATPAVPAA